jgi:glycosyltransferase involved in cell wall biosynthesis
MSKGLVRSAKAVILVFVRYYLPGFRSGGPVRSVSNLVQALAGEYDFRIVCLNRDHGVRTPYTGVMPGQWTQLGKARLYYASDQEAGFALCRRIVLEVRPDMIYLNSLFDREFSIKPLLAAGRGLAIPVLLAPRGELSPGALGLKAKRKLLFLGLAKASRYYAHVNWHASSAAEEGRIRQVFDTQSSRVFLASNLPDMKRNSMTRTAAKKPGTLKIVLPARISPMKNILTAIRMAGQLKGEVQLDLWGSLEDKSYWEICQREIAKRPPNINVSYRGEIEHAKLHVQLLEYHVLLLPTLGENFGHSIIEALDAGLPVVISDRTPWRNLAQAGVGADLPLADEAAFVRELGSYQAMNQSEMNVIREACRDYVAKWRMANTKLDNYKNMFDAVIASRE